MEDKILHFLVGVLITLLTRKMDWKLQLIVLVGCAVGKEMFDKFIQHERFDVLDALATMVGGYIIKTVRYGKLWMETLFCSHS